MSDPRTFVVAPRVDVAIGEARRLGLEPYGRGVHLITTPAALRGHSITPDDIVRFVGGPPRRDVLTALWVCLVGPWTPGGVS